MTRWIFCFLVNFWLAEIQANNEEVLNVNQLLSVIDEVKLLDFRKEYSHELDGFIPGSLLIPDVIDKATENKLR